MDDNQRRLLALQQSNPSIRLWGKNVTLGPEQAPDPSRVIAPDTRSNVAKVANFISSKTQAAPGDNRSNVARVWNTINLLDNGKSWNNFNATNDKSILQQAIDNHKAGFAGIGRSVVGSAQGLSGLYDLASRGTGTSRVSQFLNKKAEGIDAYVKNNNLDPVAYTAGQIGGDTAQLLAGGEVAQGLSKGAKVTEFLGKLGAPGRFLARLIPGGAETAQNVLQGAGQRTARGEDNSWKTVGLDAGFSVAMAGLIEGSKYGSNKIAEFLAKESDPKVIKSILPEISDQTAETLSKIDSPEEIQKAIDKVRMSDVNLNAKKAVKDPINATTIAPTAKGISPDALDTVLQTITDSTSKSDINKLVKQILPDLSTGQAKSLSKKLAETNDTNAIVNAIADAMDKKPAPKLNQESLVANTQPVEPVPGSTQEAQAVVSAQNGTSTAPVAESAPNQAVAPQAGEAGAVSAPVNQAADTAAKAVPNTATSEDATAQRILDGLKEAQAANKTMDKTRAKERAQRIAMADKAYKDAGGGTAGMQAKRAALSGEYSKADRVTITADEPTKKAIYDKIESDPKLLPYEKFNMQNSFERLFGDTSAPLQDNNIEKIATYYNKVEVGLGDEIGKQLKQALAEVKGGMTVNDVIQQVIGAPRTLMTVGDASAPRQLAVSFARHPIVTTKAYLESFPGMFKKGKFEQAVANMEKAVDPVSGKNYVEFMDSEMNIHLPNVAEKQAEEAMSSAQLLEKIPVVGHIVAASNRGMSAAVSKTRFQLAKKFIDDAGGIENASKIFSKKELADLGEVFDTITGRGGKKGGFTDQYATVLSKTLFSGKLWASRLNMLNPYWYYRLSGPAQKEALTAAASFAATAGTTLALIGKLPGVEVGTDPTSADFGKIKIGNSRIDILGGFQQNIRVAAQIATGRRTNSITGETKDTTASSVLSGVIEGKINPLIGYAWKILNTVDDPNDSNPLMRTDEWGNTLNAGTEASKLVTPLPVSGVAETMADQGPVKGALLSIPGFFGAGEQTYGNIPTKNQGQPNAYGEKTWKGKIGTDFVLDKSGQPILDAKGKPTKVKFTPGATDLEKQAQLDKAQKSALASQYKNRLSTEDQALLKLSPTERQQYLDSGKIDQARFDALAQHDQNIKNLDGVEIPKELKSTVGKNFYNTYNAMTKANQEAYLNGPADSNSQKIASNINRDLPEGISKLTPTNKLAKLYSDYEIAINKPGVDQVDKRNILKTFLSTAVKQNQSDTVQGIYNEGGSEDLKYFINAGAISQSDLDKAIQIDNELYNSGLSGSLKFSKKFRSLMGYDTPASRSGSGGGSGANISVPSFSTPAFRLPKAKTSSAPKLKAKLNLSKPSPKPRIKIAL